MLNAVLGFDKDRIHIWWDSTKCPGGLVLSTNSVRELADGLKLHDVPYAVYNNGTLVEQYGGIEMLSSAGSESVAEVNKHIDKLSGVGGVKHDSSKLPVDLLDPLALEGLTAVLEFGARKYAPNNWRQGFKYSRLIAALLRHTFALMKGERIDPESGLPHIDHIGCCWMFLSNMMKTRSDLDDLPQLPGPKKGVVDDFQVDMIQSQQQT